MDKITLMQVFFSYERNYMKQIIHQQSRLLFHQVWFYHKQRYNYQNTNKKFNQSFYVKIKNAHHQVIINFIYFFYKFLAFMFFFGMSKVSLNKVTTIYNFVNSNVKLCLKNTKDLLFKLGFAVQSTYININNCHR